MDVQNMIINSNRLYFCFIIAKSTGVKVSLYKAGEQSKHHCSFSHSSHINCLCVASLHNVDEIFIFFWHSPLLYFLHPFPQPLVSWKSKSVIFFSHSEPICASPPFQSLPLSFATSLWCLLSFFWDLLICMPKQPGNLVQRNWSV